MRQFVCARVLILAALSVLPVSAQQPQQTAPTTNAPEPQSAPGNGYGGPDIYGGYSIGAGDILDIRVADEDMLTGRYQVDQDGAVHMPLLKAPVQAAGRTTFELSQQLQKDLKEQQILREPSVTVFIVRGMSQNATVLGAVARPGIYPLEQPTTLLELFSRAGGVQANAGKEVTVTRKPEGPSAAAEPQTITIDLPALLAGKDASLNLQAKPGDVITVSTAPVVFVVGAVTHPGAFTVQGSKMEMTILQAVAMAEGTLPTAKLGDAVIVRQSANDSAREEIPIDLGRVYKGKDKDKVLMANDILFIPQSGFKAGMRRVADVAVQAAGQVAGYGMGIRLGRGF